MRRLRSGKGNYIMVDSQKNDLWYTPPDILTSVGLLLGHYFDPCPINPQYDGLNVSWGRDCFINPPYSRKLRRQFIEKGMREYDGGRYLWLLNFGNNKDVGLLHSVPWASAVCLPEKRTKFIPGHSDLGDGMSPRYDSIFILWGAVDGFEDIFCYQGSVLIKRRFYK